MRERIQGTRREQLYIYIYFVVKRNDYCNYISESKYEIYMRAGCWNY